MTINRELLKDALARLAPISGGNTSFPVLHNVLISPRPDGLSLSATNLDQHATVFVPGSGDEFAEPTTIPIRRLKQIADSCDGDVTLIKEENKVRIKSGATANFAILDLAASEFPGLASIDSSYSANKGLNDEFKIMSLDFSREELLGHFSKVIRAASTDESRYVLNGVFLNEHSIVATDGRRLAMVELKENQFFPKPAIIPTRSINHLTTLANCGATIHIQYGASFIEFSGEWGSLTSKLIDGNYPNYKQVIPAETNRKAFPVNKEELTKSIIRTNIMTSEKSPTVSLDFSATGIDLKARAAEVGEARERIDIRTGVDDLSMAFNGVYFIEALKSVAEDEVDLTLGSDQDPIMVKAGDWSTVLMPMRVDNR